MGVFSIVFDYDKKNHLRVKKAALIMMCMLLVMGVFVGCGKTSADDEVGKNTEEVANIELSKIVITGYEWGPAVNKILLKPNVEVGEFTKDTFTVTNNNALREIIAAYYSDEKGVEKSDGEYIAIEMKVGYYVGSPFVYEAKSGHNIWSEEFMVTISVANGQTFTVNGVEQTGTLAEANMINERICPEIDAFKKGTATGYWTGKNDGDKVTIQTASYTPDSVTKDAVKNPLIIWLHGGGEGGTDIDIALLGNEVSALVREEIQNQFTTDGGNKGAYVFTAQTPTAWMDSGTTQMNGGQDSIYRDVLTKAIHDYVASNPDIDTGRIYIGGCSNGGYMTMSLMVHDGDFYAAAFPVCEAYSNELLTDEDVIALAGKNIWFVQAMKDGVVKPMTLAIPTYQRLLQAGAQNCWFSMFENVVGMDDAGKSYNAHWSWIGLFNNQVTHAQDPARIINGTKNDNYGFTPTNEGGGTIAPHGYNTLFSWLNAQSRGVAKSGENFSLDFTTELFGNNVLVFSPEDNPKEVQKAIEAREYTNMNYHFTTERLAILFEPGEYDDSIEVPVGYYTTVAGLGYLPTDTDVNKIHVTEGGTLVNFWRGIENVEISDPEGTTFAVSQATFLRRAQVDGTLKLTSGAGGSGGFIADTKVNGTINSWLQQQWFTRNSYFDNWSGVEFNYLFMGNKTNMDLVDNWLLRRTVIDETPVIQEKPFLVLDEKKGYGVYVPEMKKNSTGISWEGEQAGIFIPLENNFYIAKEGIDTAETLQTALNAGKHILFTPGIYTLDVALQVSNPNTIFLGMGMATLVGSDENMDCLVKVADVDGVNISGLLFDANQTKKLLVVGDKHEDASHDKNPIVLADLFFRVGGAVEKNTTTDICVEINANDTIADNFWVWRADHGAGVGWDTNKTKNGLVVNGDRVSAYCMMVEHFHEYQTIWNGNDGYLAFYQSECPYEAPSVEAWSSHDGTKPGYASYKVGDEVTSHYAVGLGVYCHNKFADVWIGSGLEVPETDGVVIKNAFIEKLAGGGGGISHVINDKGGSTGPMQWFISIQLFENGIVKDGITCWYLPLWVGALAILLAVLIRKRKLKHYVWLKVVLVVLAMMFSFLAIIFRMNALSISMSIFCGIAVVIMLFTRKPKQNKEEG